jgi:ribonuclease HI
MPVTRRKSDTELSESLRHDADEGPVVMPGYTVLNREDWVRLLELAKDELDFKIAWKRRNRGEPEGATLDEMREKYGL